MFLSVEDRFACGGLIEFTDNGDFIITETRELLLSITMSYNYDAVTDHGNAQPAEWNLFNGTGEDPVEFEFRSVDKFPEIILDTILLQCEAGVYVVRTGRRGPGFPNPELGFLRMSVVVSGVLE